MKQCSVREKNVIAKLKKKSALCFLFQFHPRRSWCSETGKKPFPRAGKRG